MDRTDQGTDAEDEVAEDALAEVGGGEHAVAEDGAGGDGIGAGGVSAEIEAQHAVPEDVGGTHREFQGAQIGTRWEPQDTGHWQRDSEALGDEIALLAGQIAAATYQFLALLARFDEMGGWGGVGIRSLPHWLSWRAGMSLRTARDHVRVARALRDLPIMSEAFSRGELSFSKVRALTRVATPQREEELVRLARNAPAAYVERIVGGLRKVKKQTPTPTKSATPSDKTGIDATGSEPPWSAAPPRTLQWRWDEETDELVMWGRFGAADGKMLLAALTRAELERIRTREHDAADDPAECEAKTHVERETNIATESATEAEADDATPDCTAPPPIQAGPALIALAQMGLAATEAPTYAAAAEVLYVHQRPDVSDDGSTPVVRAHDGPALDEATGDEAMCGADSRCVLQSGKGAVLAYGRKKRRFSPAQLKALQLRDGGCRTPGCQRTRFLHAHHVVYWSHGGPTDLDNAILLCSGCHRSVHLGHLRILADGGQRFTFISASSNTVMEESPALFGLADHLIDGKHVRPMTIRPWTVTGGWWGEPLDLSLLTSELIAHWRMHGAWPQSADPPPRPFDQPSPPSPFAPAA
ncbi:HNH endonuclease [Ornithinimicrobium sp. Y1694]|uniref:HNH endonuclease n=1 Tax=Ornithinimicrobium sp. Y1694 TaxID=3418590 RepID=UPI003CEB2A50